MYITVSMWIRAFNSKCTPNEWEILNSIKFLLYNGIRVGAVQFRKGFRVILCILFV